MPRNRKNVLVTGFEPYGGYELNPSAEIARRLDGARIDGVPVVGRVLPVDLAALEASLVAAFAAADPAAVLLLGLAPGEAAIRLERVALNLADFTVPDNSGARATDRKLDGRPGAPDALRARLPLRAIQTRLLAAGIPARLSESAGTYLCNAALYCALRRLPARIPCGFIHLPLLPAEVAVRLEREPGASCPPSMAFPFQRRAVEMALAVTLAGATRTARIAPRGRIRGR